MKYLRFLIFAVAATLSSLTARADYHSLHIRGQVRARSTNIQLIDADVALVPPGSDDTIKTKANNIIYSGTRQARSFKETSDFDLSIPKAVPGDYELIVSYPDYETQHLFIDLSDVGSREFVRKIGTIFLEKAQPVKTLNEVTVTASKIKFYNKGDTIVYNADAFNLAEGSMLDELTNVRYSVSPSGRIESYSNTLPRYVLLHAQYKLNIMPKKKELTSKTF